MNEDERDPLVQGDLLRCLTNEVQRRAKRVRCNAGLGRARCELAFGILSSHSLEELAGLLSSSPGEARKLAACG